MAQFYFDIETTGFDPVKDKIITIQYWKLDYDAEPEEQITILKEWESSEEDIVRKFHKIFMTNNVWDFIPIGQNLIFDLTFLFAKFIQYNLSGDFNLGAFLFKKPIIDIKHTLIIANNLNFKGSGLDKWTKKAQDGRELPNWYKNKDYKSILLYIEQEADSFIEFFQELKEYLGKLKK